MKVKGCVTKVEEYEVEIKPESVLRQMWNKWIRENNKEASYIQDGFWWKVTEYYHGSDDHEKQREAIEKEVKEYEAFVTLLNYFKDSK